MNNSARRLSGGSVGSPGSPSRRSFRNSSSSNGTGSRRKTCSTKQGVLMLFLVSCFITYQSLTRLNKMLKEDDKSRSDHHAILATSTTTSASTMGGRLESLLSSSLQAVALQRDTATSPEQSDGPIQLSALDMLKRLAMLKQQDQPGRALEAALSVAKEPKLKGPQSDHTTTSIALTTSSSSSSSKAEPVSAVAVVEEPKQVKKVPVTVNMIKTPSGGPPTAIPPWLRMYFLWHKTARSRMNESNWKHRKYLVMTCFHGGRCGGVTDRLRPTIAMLRAAHESKRILLIYWERPFALEEFLLPPEGGLDWRVPEYMIPHVKKQAPATHWRAYANPRNDHPIVNALYQSWNYGWLWYNEQLEEDEPPALEIFKQVWNHLFVMSPPVQALYDQVFASLGVQSGQFATAHIRALYGLEQRPHEETVGIVRNAMNCASQLRPGGPFMVASDLLDALHEAIKYGREKNVTVVTPAYEKEPLHIGLHNESDTSVTPADFYSVFVDIYLLSQSRCVAVGPGGFGYWAQVMGHDHSCWLRHSGERSQTCDWKEAPEDSTAVAVDPSKIIAATLPPVPAVEDDALEAIIAAEEIKTKKLAIGQLEKRLAAMRLELQEAEQLLVAKKRAPAAVSNVPQPKKRMHSVSKQVVVTLPPRESNQLDESMATATISSALDPKRLRMMEILKEQIGQPQTAASVVSTSSQSANQDRYSNRLRVSHALKQTIAESQGGQIEIARNHQEHQTTDDDGATTMGGSDEEHNDDKAEEETSSAAANDDDSTPEADTTAAVQHVGLAEDNDDDGTDDGADTDDDGGGTDDGAESDTAVAFDEYVAINPQWSNLWDASATLPDWLKQYFQWHKEQRAALTTDNFREQRYMVMTCLRGNKCGGMTDRLRPILAHLQVAYKTSRLFFIFWERPFALEEFLLPPEGGLDWRMPEFLVPELYKTQRTGNLELRFYENPEPMIVSTMFQSWHYGELNYNENKAEDEPEAIHVFREAWNVLFTPSPPVAKMISNSFDELGILPGKYSTAHIRALYGIDDRGDREINVMVKNALNCLSQITNDGGPFLVAADSSAAVRLAKEYGAYRNVTVVSPPHGEHPLHLGLHNESDTSIVPSNFYSIFNDMYLIAETRCTVVGRGGFGRWGILLGHEPSCQKFHSGFKGETCGWRDPTTRRADSEATLRADSHHRVHARMPFRQPMA